MENDSKFNKIIDILNRAELLPRTTEHLRSFLFGLMDDPQFEPLLRMLESNPDVFDDFATVFRLKRRLLEHGGEQSEWEYLFHKEKSVIDLLQKKNQGA